MLPMLQKSFEMKIYLCQLSFKMAPMTVTVQGYFQNILQPSSGHECPGICECPKSNKNNPAH